MYPPVLYRRTAPGTLWRRALRRVERRALALSTARQNLERAIGCDHGTAVALVALSHEDRLLHQAARLSNDLAVLAGAAGPCRRSRP